MRRGKRNQTNAHTPGRHQTTRRQRHPLIALFFFFWRLLLALVHVLLLLLLLLLLAGGGIYHHYSKGLPDPHAIGSYRSFETTMLYAHDGQTLLYELVNPQGGHRTLISFERIPRIVRDATIAVEDANFYAHPGVDISGIARAIWLNYQHQGIVSGGSTITQQLVRNVLLPPEERHRDVATQQLYERKIREAILAYQVSRIYSKDQILSLYLNEVYYGAQAYGIEAAARAYFNKHVWELTEGEATLLAGLPQSPTTYNPFTNLEGARQRQRITLNLMVKNGYLTPRQAEEIYTQPIALVSPTTNIVAPHFVFYVRDKLEQYYGPATLYQRGLRVTTSIDLHWQEVAEHTVQHHMEQLHKRNAWNAAVVILSPEGNILAMVGSANYHDPTIDGQVNVALSPRQPGSALKPLVYAAALQKGWTPATIIWDQRTEFVREDGSAYVPLNYDNAWHGPQRLRMALANSLNIPAVKALEFVGIESFVELASRMGISTLDDPSRYSLSMALGSNEVRLLELTGAYNTFRNAGNYRPPSPIIKVESSRGEVLLKPQFQEQKHQVLGPDREKIAFLITHMLSDDEARWYMFGRNNVMELPDGIEAAVKTGTSNDWRDSWAVGYSSGVTIGVWVGNSDNAPMHEIAGANGAGLIWRDLMIAYHQEHPSHPFAPPSGLVERTVCAGTGRLPHESCPYTISEYFLEGNEPEPEQVTFKTLNVAGDGSCLAASYTPRDDIRQVEFAIYPEPFRDWARRNGIPQPPTEPCPPPDDPDHAVARLVPLSPSGEVDETQVLVSGTARYPFTLEIGAGREPSEWTLLNNGTGGVKNGLLGVWNTGRFAPGEYTLRLNVTTPEGLTIEATQVVWYK